MQKEASRLLPGRLFCLDFHNVLFLYRGTDMKKSTCCNTGALISCWRPQADKNINISD